MVTMPENSKLTLNVSIELVVLVQVQQPIMLIMCFGLQVMQNLISLCYHMHQVLCRPLVHALIDVRSQLLTAFRCHIAPHGPNQEPDVVKICQLVVVTHQLELVRCTIQATLLSQLMMQEAVIRPAQQPALHGQCAS